MKGINKESKNGMWKGNAVGYKSLHEWIRKHKPKSKICEKCLQEKPLDLSNISGKYKRDVNDYEWLCRKCHMFTDGRLVNERYCPFCDNNMFQTFFFDRLFWACLHCRTAFPISTTSEELYCIKNEDKIRERHQKYYQKNKKRISEYNKQYRQKHKEKLNQYLREYRKRKKIE